MEYEKHIKRLVLGYLKNQCKNTYKAFLKYNFQNSSKHIATRVAGQTLEDILQSFSRVQEIIQGRLEETEFYKEKNPEFSSPLYLVDQLNYLLENQPAFTPSSTPCPRSPGESSVAESRHGHRHDRVSPHATDIETTPEHLLPGNMLSSTEDDYNATPFQNSKSSFNKTLEKYATPDKEILGEVVTKKMLENPEFQENLASTINTVLNQPSGGGGSSHKYDERLDRSKEKFDAELNATIRSVQQKIEDRPVYKDLIDDLLYNTPIVETISKAVETDSSASTSNVLDYMPDLQRKSWNCFEETNKEIPSSQSNTNQPVNNTLYNSSHTSAISTSSTTSSTTPLSVVCSTPNVMPAHPQPPQPPPPSSQCVFNSTPTNVYMVTQPASTIQNLGTSQQFFVVNPPMIIPQTTSLIQVGQSCINPNVAQPSQPATPLKEQDIMGMPTIILNENNEITYADSVANLATGTPLRTNEAASIKEYLTLYGASDQSPILKVRQKPRRRDVSLRPMPTVRVEIYKPPEISSSQPVQICEIEQPKGLKELPNLNESIQQKPVEPIENTAEKPIQEPKAVKNLNGSIEQKPAESIKNTAEKPIQEPKAIKNLPSIFTPSPIVTAVAKKPTPKSGSHVRNLTFPSPLKTTPVEKEGDPKSPRVVNKQQATKDLFKDNAEKQPAEVKSPKTTNEKKTCKTPKKTDSWDSNLRRMIDTGYDTVTPLTPAARRKRTARKATADRNALNTPVSKSALKRKPAKVKKNRTPPTTTEPTSTAPTTDTMVLSPSKLNANKRNLLSTDIENITPDSIKDLARHPISAKRRRNLNNLLETPMKDDNVSIPPTPGRTTDTPFTPMLKANLKDLTEGDDIFDINTPNLPITPGFSLEAHASDYYIPKANDTDKATEAIVSLEEKKSSVRSTDTDLEDDHPVTVYGARAVLENFNKSRLGRKNLELLDRENATWDAGSDKDDKSDDSDEESNATVIQAKTVEVKQIKTIMPKKKRSSGKQMEVLTTQLMQERSDDSQTSEENTTEVLINEADSAKKGAENGPREHAQKRISETSQTAEEIKKTLSGMMLDLPMSVASSAYSAKAQLEAKRERVIQQEKYSLRKTAGRVAAATKPKPAPKSPKNKRKSASPKKVVKGTSKMETRSKKRLLQTESDAKEDVPKKIPCLDPPRKNKESVADDSQDEFFKKSGTNLHRKNKDSSQTFSDSVEKDLTDHTERDDSVENASSINESKEQNQLCNISDELSEEFDTHWTCEETVVVYDPKLATARKIEDYDLSTLSRSRLITLPCADGEDISVVTSVCPFTIVLDIPSTLNQNGNGNDADDNPSRGTTCDILSDSETPDEVDGMKVKKRKRRSDSCESNSSEKKANTQALLSNINIQNLLTVVHGPNKPGPA